MRNHAGTGAWPWGGGHLPLCIAAAASDETRGLSHHPPPTRNRGPVSSAVESADLASRAVAGTCETGELAEARARRVRAPRLGLHTPVAHRATGLK